MKKAIITGVNGQDGAYLARLLLGKGYQVYGTVRDRANIKLFRLDYLGIKNDIVLSTIDLLNLNEVEEYILRIRPDEIYNLAAQSSVGQSFSSPMETFNFNTVSVNNLLEVIRKVNQPIKFYQASSSEMFGDVKLLPITVNTPLNPSSPYGVSKVASHFMVKIYRETYKLFLCNGILFNHESYLRGGNFFVKKVIRETLNIKNGNQEFLCVGNLNVKRDFGFAPKYVEAMWLMLQQKVPGDHCICSGSSIYLYEIVHFVMDYLGVSRNKLMIDESLFRPNEIDEIKGCNLSAKNNIQWDYDLDFFDVLKHLIDEEVINSEY